MLKDAARCPAFLARVTLNKPRQRSTKGGTPRQRPKAGGLTRTLSTFSWYLVVIALWMGPFAFAPNRQLRADGQDGQYFIQQRLKRPLNGTASAPRKEAGGSSLPSACLKCASRDRARSDLDNSGLLGKDQGPATPEGEGKDLAKNTGIFTLEISALEPNHLLRHVSLRSWKTCGRRSGAARREIREKDREINNLKVPRNLKSLLETLPSKVGPS